MEKRRDVLAVSKRAVSRYNATYDVEHRFSRLSLPIDMIALSEAHDRGNLRKSSPLMVAEQLMTLTLPWIAGPPRVDGVDRRPACAASLNWHKTPLR